MPEDDKSQPLCYMALIELLIGISSRVQAVEVVGFDSLNEFLTPEIVLVQQACLSTAW